MLFDILKLDIIGCVLLVFRKYRYSRRVERIIRRDGNVSVHFLLVNMLDGHLEDLTVFIWLGFCLAIVEK